jgi:hypothetical protein
METALPRLGRARACACARSKNYAYQNSNSVVFAREGSCFDYVTLMRGAAALAVVTNTRAVPFPLSKQAPGLQRDERPALSLRCHAKIGDANEKCDSYVHDQSRLRARGRESNFENEPNG